MVDKSKRKDKPMSKLPQKQRIIKWFDAVDIITPHTVKIITPRGSGTGFLCAYSKNKQLCGIATAAHVVIESDYWEEPIRIAHYTSRKVELLRVPDRAIWLDRKKDSAVILMEKKAYLPKETLNLIPEEKCLRVGAEIGWVGFPAVALEDLCFFTGTVSNWKEESGFYLVDGVVINGVSGGPAISLQAYSIDVVGVVTAYLPNIQGPTPGLGRINDIWNHRTGIMAIRNMDEAHEVAKKQTTDVNFNK